jgi:hypothetical protein
LHRHSGEGRARSEAFLRYPGGFKKLVFPDAGFNPHDGKLWTVKLSRTYCLLIFAEIKKVTKIGLFL